MFVSLHWDTLVVLLVPRGKMGWPFASVLVLALCFVWSSLHVLTTRMNNNAYIAFGLSGVWTSLAIRMVVGGHLTREEVQQLGCFAMGHVHVHGP